MKNVVYKRKKTHDGGDVKEPKGISAKAVLYGIIVTAVLYVLLIFIERSIVNADDKTQVYVAVKEVPDNLEVTVLNISDYFAIEDRPASVIPDGCITHDTQLVGCITDRTIKKNEIVTVTSLSTVDDRIKGIDNPIEVSINASSLSQFVGGVLRTGDFINIWSVKTDTVNGEKVTETKQICSHAYITRTFGSSGETAAEGDSEMAAMIINIIIPAEQEEEFNTAVSEGTLRVGRYLYDVDESMENVTVTDDEESLTDSSKEQDYSGVTGTTEAMETTEETTASDDGMPDGNDGMPEYEMPSIDKKVR